MSPTYCLSTVLKNLCIGFSSLMSPPLFLLLLLKKLKEIGGVVVVDEEVVLVDREPWEEAEEEGAWRCEGGTTG